MNTIKAIRSKSHSDEVSGTTEFSDGTKAYWTEGRSSEVILKHPDGTTTSYNVSCTPEQNKYEEILSGDEYGDWSQMNREEEIEYAIERYEMTREQAEAYVTID